jgi:transcriptional regulator with XRE-family HTH domain
MSISEQLREAIEQSGLSLREIAKASGVTQPALSYFLSEKPSQRRGIHIETADKLAEYFGMALTAPKSSKPTADASGKPPTSRRPVKKADSAHPRPKKRPQK